MAPSAVTIAMRVPSCDSPKSGPSYVQSVADRREHEEALVRRWHSRLVASGVTGYSFDAAWADYRRALVMQMSIPVVGSFMPMADERAAQLVDAMLDRAMTALDDHRPVEFFIG